MIHDKKNNKTYQLKKIAFEIAKCRGCKKNTSGLPVPGEGDPNARVMFVGEAPGRKEAETGRPFVGRAGKLLTELLTGIGIKRSDVYITSPVKYYPGKRTPKSSEIKHGAVHLLAQINIIQPKCIVLLGKSAHKALIGDVPVVKNHGKSFKKGGIVYFSTFHPAAALRFPKYVKVMEEDFAKLKTLI